MAFFSEFITEGVLPFLLVFVVMFAILQRSKILGEGQHRIDAIVSLVIGLILIMAPGPRDMIVGILPWLAVAVAIVLVFLILFGFVAGDFTGSISKQIKWAYGIIAMIFVIAVVLYVTGLGGFLGGLFADSTDTAFWTNAFILLLVVGAMVAAVMGSGKRGNGGSGQSSSE